MELGDSGLVVDPHTQSGPKGGVGGGKPRKVNGLRRAGGAIKRLVTRL